MQYFGLCPFCGCECWTDTPEARDDPNTKCWDCMTKDAGLFPVELYGRENGIVPLHLGGNPLCL